MSDKMNWTAAAAAAERLAAGWTPEAPGGTVLGFDAQGVRFAASGGVESLATLVPFGPRTVVRFASVTKHVFCAMVLSHPDRIGLDDPLGAHLPELRAAAPVTVGQALAMTGGLPDTRECLTLHGLSVTSLTDAPALYAYMAGMVRLNYPAGTEISYSNTGYRLVETAMDRKGLRFDDFVQSTITRGLGIPMKAAEMWTDPVRGLVPGYWKSPAGWQVGAQGMHLSAAGSLCGSAEGLAGWLRALIAGEGQLAGHFARLRRPRPLASGRATDYALGLRWSAIGGRRFVGHGGSQPGFKAYFLLDPETGAGVVVVSNREDADSYGLAKTVIAEGLGLDLPRPVSPDWAPAGLYVAEAGPRWVELRASSLVHLDAEEKLYDDGAGRAVSHSGSAPVSLRRDGQALVGEIGLSPVRLLPAAPEAGPAGAVLDGRWWDRDQGACFEIRDGSVIWGIGPQREAMPLTPLGHGRWLFTRHDGPWTKRICLNLLDADRLELAMSRARIVEYRRAF